MRINNVRNTVSVLEDATPDSIPFEQLFAKNEPVILKGLVRDWPLVQEGKKAPGKVMEQLEVNDSGRPMIVYQGAADIKARFGYDDTCTGFNYTSHKSTISEVFSQIREQLSQHEHDYYYINSLRLDEGFPALSLTHKLNFDHPEFEQNHPVAKIWLGTESVAAAHFDQPKNIACCVLGKRRFTLFPPDQVENLYPGPLTPTPGGQVVTVANLAEPDLSRFPRLKTALDNAYIADLEPGDGLYYPSMWWHEVEAFERFNVMVNYWWMTAAPYLGSPMDVLMHAMLSLRDKPTTEKQAWKALFDYYIFNDPDNVREHLPVECHGAFANMDDNLSRRIRALLRNNLNR